jgi:hypothetical protein
MTTNNTNINTVETLTIIDDALARGVELADLLEPEERTFNTYAAEAVYNTLNFLTEIVRSNGINSTIYSWALGLVVEGRKAVGGN